MSAIFGLLAAGISAVHEGIYVGLLGLFGMTEADQGAGLIALQFLSCVILASILILPPSILCYSLKQCLCTRHDRRRPFAPASLAEDSQPTEGSDASSGDLDTSHQLELASTEVREDEPV